MTTIVLPLDGSSRAEAALTPSLNLALAIHADVVVVAASEGDRTERAVEYLDSLRTRREAENVRAWVDPGHAVGAVQRALDSFPDSVLVLPTRAHTGVGAMTLGSTADDIIVAVDSPILVVGPAVDKDWTPRAGGILVFCFDGAPGSRALEPLVVEWAEKLGLEVHVVLVLHRHGEFLADHEATNARIQAAAAADRCRAVGIATSLEILEGVNPASAIVAYAEACSATLLAASAHSHSGVVHRTIGSVAMRIAHHASCPVLVRRPPDS